MNTLLCLGCGSLLWVRCSVGKRRAQGPIPRRPAPRLCREFTLVGVQWDAWVNRAQVPRASPKLAGGQMDAWPTERRVLRPSARSSTVRLSSEPGASSAQDHSTSLRIVFSAAQCTYNFDVL